jgi:hypothetical protein
VGQGRGRCAAVGAPVAPAAVEARPAGGARGAVVPAGAGLAGKGAGVLGKGPCCAGRGGGGAQGTKGPRGAEDGNAAGAV